MTADCLSKRYAAVRSLSEDLCRPLSVEDYVIQPMADASPTKWHLAHTTWFFETFVLRPHMPGYPVHDERYAYLFNSYYVQAGERFDRPRRGLLSRPGVAEVYAYRHHVDEWMVRFLGSEAPSGAVLSLVELGLHHEQQHQELLLTDVKYMLAQNPLYPAYREDLPVQTGRSPIDDLRWIAFEDGVREIGHRGPGFCFDNEEPRHRVFLEPFELADRPVTNGEYLRFIEEGGYGTAVLWLSEGHATVRANGWEAPLYWVRRDGEWFEFTLAGLRKLDPASPVTHVSYWEADAFARWADARLATEAEWEVAAEPFAPEGGFVDDGLLHPERTPPGPGLRRLYGDTWEWTSSSYGPYPGYRPAPGAIGEYNGKFMANQYVLRGGSCATSRDHIRSTYRNFFQAPARWQFSGIRLARSTR